MDFIINSMTCAQRLEYYHKIYENLLFILDTDFNVYLFDKEVWLEHHGTVPSLQYQAAEKTLEIDKVPYTLVKFFKRPWMWEIILQANYRSCTRDPDVAFLKSLIRRYKFYIYYGYKHQYNEAKARYIASLRENEESVRLKHAKRKLKRRVNSNPYTRHHVFTTLSKFSPYKGEPYYFNE